LTEDSQYAHYSSNVDVYRAPTWDYKTQSDPPGTVSAIATFLGLMKTQSEVAVENMVHVDTARDNTGKEPYRRKIFSIDKDGNASVVSDEKTLPIKRYLPGHPYADAEGLVLFPNFNLIQEIIQLDNAKREYCLAESLLERCLPGNYMPDPTMQMLKQSVS
jgi:flagellar basal-body rod protein FlgC